MNQVNTEFELITKAIINCERSINLLKDADQDTNELEVKLMKLKIKLAELNIKLNSLNKTNNN